DPPWQFDNSGFDQSAAAHYPTMSTDEISKMEIPAADHSVLFMWATNAMLEDALQVVEVWGFDYKTNIVWVKDRGPGIGWYVTSRHELLLIATKGEGMHPVHKPISVIDGEVKRHSKKPDKFYGLIEGMYDGPYLELFARNKRDGWESWGNEVK
ncbi:MAG: MT-A70 family methyltransferase, partial [Planctomycetota bacterium]